MTLAVCMPISRYASCREPAVNTDTASRVERQGVMPVVISILPGPWFAVLGAGASHHDAPHVGQSSLDVVVGKFR